MSEDGLLSGGAGGIQPSETEKALTEHIKALISHSPDIARILTQILDVPEADDFGELDQIAKDYKLKWLEHYMNYRRANRMSIGRSRELAITEILKRQFASEEEKKDMVGMLKKVFRQV